MSKFIGANTDFSTAQAFIFPRVLTDELNEPVFGLIISGEGEDIFVKVRQKILNLEEEFKGPFERVVDKLHELLETFKTEFSEVENLKLTLFCAKENVFYVLGLGNNLVEILREGEILPVISDSSQEKIVSGFIKSGDRILVLSSKPGESNWSREVINQVFTLPLDSVEDAEAIFAQGEIKENDPQDLSGVKNIEPVAFILIENQLRLDRGQLSKDSQMHDRPAVPEKPLLNFKLKIPTTSLLIYLRKIIRRTFGLIRAMNKKVLLVLLVLILLLISSSIGFFYYQSAKEGKNKRVENLISAVENHLTQAQNYKDSDIKQAVSEITQAKEKLNEISGLDKKDTRFEDIRKKVEEKESEVLKIYKNFDLELFLSLDLIKQTFKTTKLSFSVGKILILDSAEKSLVAIDTKLKTPNIIAGAQQLGDAKYASINGGDVFVYSSDKGLLHYDLNTDKLAMVSKPDEGWGEIRDIFGFSSNVYVLDSAKNMIWKYAPTANGFSQKIEYLRGKADLILGKKLMIDYSVWVVTSEPDILKFTAGNSDFYAISGLDKPLNQIDSLFVTEDLDSVFILDKLNNRILVTKKNGEYLAQYVKPELGKVDDFFVDEVGKAIYLLIENKIYKTSLRS